MRAALALLLASSLAYGADPAVGTLAADAPRYEVQAVGGCNAVDGPVGSGCWMPEQDCIASAKERAALRQALREAELKPAGSGPGLKSFIGLAVVTLGLGFAVGMAVH